MKLVTLSVIVVCGLFIVLGLTNQIGFAIIGTISLLPINLLYGSMSFSEFQQDKKKYDGPRIFAHPLLLVFVLIFTKPYWLG
ncbi:hypothetical protein CWE12_05820 [Aliidiomarina sedimenti]|uniref:Uncharacterized protein n=1 Tax=Aliidiomarina sedimenti TaxID=1933879 RepID=A0ABY0C000_9GAMM|nr:hypothetical protein [Aliidiomarina sedimenti]RUO30757.1 hypothetical protein CWE12_05820 [Aliidiomarina sedimenti]